MQGGDNCLLKQAGLPNITGSAGISRTKYAGNYGAKLDGAFAPDNSYNGHAVGGGNVVGFYGGSFDASRCSTIYGASNTVQPASIVLLPKIRF